MARGRPKGIPLSEEAKAKMRAYWTAHYADPANRAKTSDACRSAWADPSQHQRRAAIISGALKGKARPLDIVARISKTQRLVRATPECKRRQTQAAITTWADPAKRERIVAGMKKSDSAVRWTDDMQQEVIRLLESSPMPSASSVSGRLGVDRQTLLRFMSAQGIAIPSKWTRAARPKHETPRSGKKKIDQCLVEKQRQADAYAQELLEADNQLPHRGGYGAFAWARH